MQAVGSILDPKRTHRTHILSQVNILGDQLQASPRKSLTHFAQETAVSASSLQNERKLLNRHLCATTVVHRLSNADCETKLNFVNWYLYVMQVGEIISFLVLFSSETLYHLSEYVNSQNESFWYVEYTVPLRVVKVGECCSMTATSIIRHIF